MTENEQRIFIKERMNYCLDCMEGCDALEFIRWERLFCAYADIYTDMQAESAGEDAIRAHMQKWYEAATVNAYNVDIEL